MRFKFNDGDAPDFDPDGNPEPEIKPLQLLTMTCPSTGKTHALRVPPNIANAREAIRWINWGIDPEDFAVQT